MFFICAILFAACCSFAADWSDVATKPSQVQVDGKPYYEISSAKELAWFSNEVASGKNNINAILKNDIVLWDSVSGDTNYWTPIGLADSLAFEGIFDGNGKTINGARSEHSLEKVDTVFNGFFRFVGEKGIVKNFTLKNSLITSEHLGSDTVMTLDEFAKNTPFFFSVVGCVAGVNKGLIDSVRVLDVEPIAKGSSSTRTVVKDSARISSVMVNGYVMRYFVGGVVGLNKGAVTHIRANDVHVSPHGSMVTMYMGGIVGANVGTVSESLSEASLDDAVPAMLGGICGKNEGTLDHVKMVGNIENVTGFVGGIVSENHGRVTWSEYTGSLGRAGDGGVSIGGIAAYNTGTISKSFYGFIDKSQALRLTATLDDFGLGISPEAFAGGIVARQSNQGIVEDCGVHISWLVLGNNGKTSTSMYSGGIVGIDSGSVYNSYAAFYKISSIGNKAPLYNVVVGGKHEGNHYDSVLMQTPFPKDTTGLEQSLMKSSKFAWILNTKYKTESNRNIWCYNGDYPVLARDGRKPTYSVIRYVNGVVFDTAYTDCNGRMVWLDSMPDPLKDKTPNGWKIMNGSKMVNINSGYVFAGDTSIYTTDENFVSFIATKPKLSITTSVDRGWIYIDGVSPAESVALFDVQGRLVKRETSTNNHLAIPLTHSGMYILMYKGTSYKVRVP